MSIAITEDHRALAEVAADFLGKHDARGVARGLLESDSEGLPAFWNALGELGWLGLHIDEEHGGSGFGLAELVVVVEELGRAVAPGPFVPTVIASAVLAATAPAGVRDRLLPGLVGGSTVAGIGLDGEVEVRGGAGFGSAGVVLGGGMADLVLVPAGEDIVVVDRHGAGVEVTVPMNLDPTRRSARVSLDGAPVEVIAGARGVLVDLARLILAAEAIGVARECTTQAAEYAKVREQFGRPIAMFQAVKHHCANMLVEAELATAAVWDAARAGSPGTDQFSYAAAMAATLAVPAAELDAQLNIQVHGGIGFTWEHDAHLFLRRASAIAAIVDVETAAIAATNGVRDGVKVSRSVDLPPEAEPLRDAVRAVVAEVRDLDDDARTRALVSSGYAVPHWPKPWGRDAGAVEQLVIEEEFVAAGIKRPSYGITSWVILTLIQHGSEDQIARWIRPALDQEVIWCQLFSEPDAGSDAAGVKTKATRVDGGWLVNGQKVWTSGAHVAGFGLATVRTNPDVPKHSGITTMVVDLAAPGVEIRPLRMPSGGSEFNEVFFNDVFVPDDDVVGPVDSGWTVARATLGNESVSIGGGQGGTTIPSEMLIAPLDAHPERLAGGAGRVGRYIARTQAVETLNLRSAHRAVAGGEPGPEGAVTKLVLSENFREAAMILFELSGPDGAFLDGPGAIGGSLVLMHRALSIAGGTSEIKRNQIGERLLGLPRDPLVK
jgi:alkylation response protein AidB-like acyl-CoA dehydrogenase